jgi:ABC-type multidrug transport system ATPase subunit
MGTRRNRQRVERVVLERVGCVFGSTVALRGLSGEFVPGPIHMIVGSNGSGKSTLLRAVGTTLRPTTGQVLYQPALTLAQVRAEVGWLSHECLVYPDLTGRDNVLLAARLYGLEARPAWERVRERFALGRFADRPVRTNSRGQRQRIAMARALVHDPSLVLLDEPSTGLDEEGLGTLRRVLSEEIGAGKLVLMVTHDPQTFTGLPSRLWRIDRGRWVS